MTSLLNQYVAGLFNETPESIAEHNHRPGPGPGPGSVQRSSRDIASVPSESDTLIDSGVEGKVASNQTTIDASVGDSSQGRRSGVRRTSSQRQRPSSRHRSRSKSKSTTTSKDSNTTNNDADGGNNKLDRSRSNHGSTRRSVSRSRRGQSTTGSTARSQSAERPRKPSSMRSLASSSAPKPPPPRPLSTSSHVLSSTTSRRHRSTSRSKRAKDDSAVGRPRKPHTASIIAGNKASNRGKKSPRASDDEPSKPKSMSCLILGSNTDHQPSPSMKRAGSTRAILENLPLSPRRNDRHIQEAGSFATKSQDDSMISMKSFSSLIEAKHEMTTIAESTKALKTDKRVATSRLRYPDAVAPPPGDTAMPSQPKRSLSVPVRRDTPPPPPNPYQGLAIPSFLSPRTAQSSKGANTNPSKSTQRLVPRTPSAGPTPSHRAPSPSSNRRTRKQQRNVPE